MPKWVSSQKIGARGQKSLSSHVEEHGDWISRKQEEDYGIDLEFELQQDGELKGDLLKVQVKTVEEAIRRGGNVKVQLARKYLTYAASCRYPVILILVCLRTKQAWYIWLQQWLLFRRIKADPLSTDQKNWTEWIPENQTVMSGLSSELKAIARWEGEVQLVLTLLDTMRCASAIGKLDIVRAVGGIMDASAPFANEAVLNALISQALVLGNRMRGTHQGNIVAQQIYGIIRFGGQIVTKEIAINLVMRGGSYSRVGLDALGILYDKFFAHAKSLHLSKAFEKLAPEVAFYCALRESLPGEKWVCVPPNDFRYAGLKYLGPDDYLNKYINRGPSAILDYLVPEDYEPKPLDNSGP